MDTLEVAATFTRRGLAHRFEGRKGVRERLGSAMGRSPRSRGLVAGAALWSQAESGSGRAVMLEAVGHVAEESAGHVRVLKLRPEAGRRWTLRAGVAAGGGVVP